MVLSVLLPLPTQKLLELHSNVSSATTSAITAVAATAACAQFFAVGLLGPGLGLWQCFLGFLGAWGAEQVKQRRLLDDGSGTVSGILKPGQATLLLASAVGAAALVLVLHGLGEVNSHGLRSFRTICRSDRVP